VVRVALISSGLIRLPPMRGGAVEEYVYQLVKHLRRLGVDAVAVDSTHGGKPGLEEVEGAPILRVSAPDLRRAPKGFVLTEYAFGFRAAKVLREMEVEIVHANTSWAGFALAKSLRGISLVYTCHNPLWPEERVHAQEYAVRLVEGYAMKRSAAVVALNNTMKRSIVAKAGVNKAKVVVVPNGVDVEFFRPGIPADDVAERFGLEGRRVVLFVGRVTRGKGVHVLLKAFRVLAKRYPDLKLVVAGPLSDRFGEEGVSEYARALMAYAERSLSEGSYVFTGAVDRETLRKLYSTAYVCVLPSYFEAFPMVLIEAMASGCPVIGSDAGGIPDIVVDGYNGLLFRRGDYADLASKLKMLLEDESLRNAMSANARRYAVEKFGWQAVALKMRNVYRAVLAK